jgi:integrase/recombinase XerD
MSPLRRRMIEDMQIRNLTQNTQRGYAGQVGRFARHFRKFPEHLGPGEIRHVSLRAKRSNLVRADNSMFGWRALRSGVRTSFRQSPSGMVRRMTTARR